MEKPATWPVFLLVLLFMRSGVSVSPQKKEFVPVE